MLFPDQDAESHYLHRSDPDDVLGSFLAAPFELEGLTWPTVEHYFHAMKFHDHDMAFVEKIRAAKSPEKARKMGRSRLHKVRADWKKVRRVVMTRAIYTRCKTHPHLAEALLDTGDQRLLEASQYDYFWGCGRDRRGENQYGEVLMSVRQRLRDEEKK